MKVWIDGAVVDGAEARVPVTDHGFLYGDGIFEGMRIYGRRIFRLEDHLRRLAVSARAVGLTIPGGLDAVRELLFETARAHDADEAYVRLIVSRGEGALGVDPTTCPDPRVVCIIDAVRLYPEETLQRGVALLTSSLRRPAGGVLDPRIKSLNYLNNALAKLEAKQRGGDEALLLNDAGCVAEASVANVVVVKGRTLRTPPATDGALPGITCDTVLRLAREAGFTAEERSLGRSDLYAADEVFLTGSGARIVPVGSLDGEPVGWGGERPVMTQLSEAFARHAPEAGVPFDR